MPGVGEGHRLLRIFLNSISVTVASKGTEIETRALEETERILTTLPPGASDDVLRMFVEVRDVLQTRISRRGVMRPRCTENNRQLFLRLVSCVKADWKGYSRAINAEIADAPACKHVHVQTTEQDICVECDDTHTHTAKKQMCTHGASDTSAVIATRVKVSTDPDSLAEELARWRTSHQQLKMAYDALVEIKERSVAYSEYLLDYIADRQLGSALPRHKDQMQIVEEVAFGGISHELLLPHAA